MEQFKNVASALVVALAIPAGVYAGLVLMGLDKVAAKGTSALRGAFGKTSIGRRMEARARTREAIKQQKALNLESKLASGTYKGLNPFYKARSATNRARARVLGGLSSGGEGVVGGAGRAVAERLGGGYLAEQIIMDRNLRAKERANAMADFGDNTVLAQAWVETGGGRDLSAASYKKLTAKAKAGDANAQATLTAFRQLQLGGRHTSAESFIAAQQMLASEGEGSWSTLQAAKQYASGLGASAIETSGLEQASISAWRKGGRGDIDQVASGYDKDNPDTLGKGWAAVRPETISRHALDDPDKQAKFLEWFDHATIAEQRSVLVGYNKMEGRAKDALAKTLALKYGPNAITDLLDDFKIQQVST